MSPGQRFVQRKRVREVHIQVPVGGLNTVASGLEMPPTDAVLCWNLIGAEYGLRTRLGWREWCTGLDGQVRTILPFRGVDGVDKLFATTSTGIWDVTASTATPAKVLTFGLSDSTAGWGSCTEFVNLAGNHFLLYCDETNGYHVFNGATWAAITQGAGGTQINGVNPTTLAHVMVWKNRVWFTQKGTGFAWYLAVGALYGTATAFQFGTRFREGGPLRALYSWTHDGFAGMDDSLVAVSGGGDVLIYNGTDPDQPGAFALVGVSQIGAVPLGRRIGTENGGDLLLMSSLGLVSMNRLHSGPQPFDRAQYDTLKISNLFNQLQLNSANQLGWAMHIHPADSALIVIVPDTGDGIRRQLVMSLVTRGWHQYRGMPAMSCGAAWVGDFYFGTDDGRVCVNKGYVDGITLAAPSAFSTIPWSVIPAFSIMGSPVQKQIQQIRVRTLSQFAAVPVNAEARYGMDLTEAAAPYIPAPALGDTWDSGKWDQAKWGGDYFPAQSIFGATGIGSEVSIAVRGEASSRMTLVGIDATVDAGEF